MLGDDFTLLASLSPLSLSLSLSLSLRSYLKHLWLIVLIFEAARKIRLSLASSMPRTQNHIDISCVDTENHLCIFVLPRVMCARNNNETIEEARIISQRQSINFSGEIVLLFCLIEMLR